MTVAVNQVLRTSALRRRHLRHPAEVTSDRLLEHHERWYDKLSCEERDAVSTVRYALQQIAEGER